MIVSLRLSIKRQMVWQQADFAAKSGKHTHAYGQQGPLLVTLTKYCHYYNEYLRDIGSCSIMWNFCSRRGIKTNYRDQQQLSFVILLTLPNPGPASENYGQSQWQHGHRLVRTSISKW